MTPELARTAKQWDVPRGIPLGGRGGGDEGQLKLRTSGRWVKELKGGQAQSPETDAEIVV